MKWIKNRGDRVFSALLACTLFASAIMVSARLGSFKGGFSEPNGPVLITEPRLETISAPVERATTDLNNPPNWNGAEAGARGSIFVPEKYILSRENMPVKVDEYSSRIDSVTHQPIPNKWFSDQGLSALEANAQFLDPDKDGFTNEDEWRYGTNPRNGNSHPPYYSKLFLKQYIRVPCRLVFRVFSGDVRKPRTWEFQVDTIDIKQPTSFLKIGDMVPNTKFKLEGYVSKEERDPRISDLVDLSELTLVNTETNENVVLVIGKVADVPDKYALFDYQWPAAAGEIRVRKLQDFGLRPESGRDSFYRLMNVNESEATIRLPNGEIQTIGHDPRKAGK